MSTKHLIIVMLVFTSVASCKPKGESDIKDVTIMGGQDHIGFAYLQLNNDIPSEIRASLQIDKMRVYAMDPGGNSGDPVYEKLSDLLFEEFRQDRYIEQNPTKYIDTLSSNLSLSEKTFFLPLPMGNKISLNIRDQNGLKSLSVRDFETLSWQVCPFNMTDKTNPFVTHFKKTRPDLNLAISEPSYPPSPPRPRSATDVLNDVINSPLRASSLRFTRNKITYQLKCRFPARLSGIDKSFDLTVDASVTVQFERDIFSVPLPDQNFELLSKGQNITERDGRGTRYFYDKFNPYLKNLILRWNPKRQPIIIDDVLDGNGVALNSSTLGRIVQTSYKLAIGDIRKKFPELGQRMVLLSETTEKRLPDITATMGDEILGAIGMAGVFYQDNTGEITMARISLGQDSNMNKKRAMLENFKEIGLTDDVNRDMTAIVQYTVFHELGHALGLRHNFKGFFTTSNGQVTFNAIMSYAYLGVPLSLLEFKPQFLEHDILSLKYLYADLFSDPRRVRHEISEKLMNFPLSEDEATSLFSTNHLQPAVNFLSFSNHSKVRKVLEKIGSRVFFQKIKAAYKSAYNMNVDF